MECICLVLPPCLRPSQKGELVGFSLVSANTIFRGLVIEVAAISLCSGLTVCLPPRSFLPLQVKTHRAAEAFLCPSRTCVVTFARIGYAIRPTTGNWRNGRGRDSDCSLPPAQTRAGATSAHGSYLRCWDVWRRSARRGRGAGSGPVAAGKPGGLRNAPSSCDGAGCDVEASVSSSSAHRCETLASARNCPERRDIGNTPSPLAAATPRFLVSAR